MRCMIVSYYILFTSTIFFSLQKSKCIIIHQTLSQSCNILKINMSRVLNYFFIFGIMICIYVYIVLCVRILLPTTVVLSCLIGMRILVLSIIYW